MTARNKVETLKQMLRGCRWAFDEMVYDQKMQEANRLVSDRDPKAMLKYLAEKFGSLDTVMRVVQGVAVRQERARTLAKSKHLNGE